MTWAYLLTATGVCVPGYLFLASAIRAALA